MVSKKAFIAMIALISFQTPFCVPPCKAQSGDFIKGQWVPESKFGFPVLTAANFVIDAPAFNHRHIYMFVDAADFNEKNILILFTSLAETFKVPDDLEMIVYSDRAAVQKAVDKGTNGVLCILWAEAPEGRRASRNYDIKTNPHQSGFFRADYYRQPDGREVKIRFSPDPGQEHLNTIYHANPPFAYSDSKKDLIRAAERGDIETVERLLSLGNQETLLKSAGSEALQAAAGNGQSEIVNVLLNAGVPANGSGDKSALLSATTDGNLKIVRLLLERGADVNARTGQGKNELDDSALMLAALHGHRDVVEELLAKGAKINDRNSLGETALIQAALAGFPEIVKLLIEKGADGNARD
jgi:hypothetical protein